MVFTQRLGIAATEGRRELLVSSVEVLAEGLSSEIQAAREPEEALGGCVRLFLRELGADEGLQSVGVQGGGELAVAELFHVALHVGFDGFEGHAAEDVKELCQAFARFEEFGRGDGIVGGAVHGDIGEGALVVEEGAAGWEGHGGRMECGRKRTVVLVRSLLGFVCSRRGGLPE